MKIKFLEDREVQDGHQNTNDAEMYKKDQVLDLPQSSAEHWISRGVAVKVEDEKPVAPVARVSAPTPPPVVPAPVVKPADVSDDDNKSSGSLTVSGATVISGTSTVGGATSTPKR